MRDDSTCNRLYQHISTIDLWHQAHLEDTCRNFNKGGLKLLPLHCPGRCFLYFRWPILRFLGALAASFREGIYHLVSHQSQDIAPSAPRRVHFSNSSLTRRWRPMMDSWKLKISWRLPTGAFCLGKVCMSVFSSFLLFQDAIYINMCVCVYKKYISNSNQTCSKKINLFVEASVSSFQHLITFPQA